MIRKLKAAKLMEYINPDTMQNTFVNDVEKGLNAKPKYLDSKYFYDEKGDYLFQKIMELDEYYLTDCELEILKTHCEHYRRFFQNAESHFSLVELGAGDGYKTKVLLEHLTENQTNFSYLPIDISNNVLKILEAKINRDIPKLKIDPYTGDYFNALDNINEQEAGRKVLLFLGSTIGNFKYEDAIKFLKELNQRMNREDMLLIGFDLKKDPITILNAYNDNKGITKAFNLNLLERINNELGGNFNLADFYHYPTYNPVNGEAQSYLISQKEQKVMIRALDQSFLFEEGEPIFMEISKKYDPETINTLAEEAGFDVKENFFDQKEYFTNSLWKKH